MITFKTIEWSNFMSVGNAPMSIQLDAAPTTLVVGKNGVGKSQVLDSLTFALFGRAFRDVNKDQLVNSVNGKNAKVTLEFDIDGVEYKVERGIKPSIFKIFRAGKLLNQSASKRDYQHILEQQILKFGIKTFTQVIVLGAATFVPFMQLKPDQRRSVIEDILGISVFSIMSKLATEQLVDTKGKLNQLTSDIKLAVTQVKSKKELISRLGAEAEQSVESISAKLSEVNKSASEIELNARQLTSELTTLNSNPMDQPNLSDQNEVVTRLVTRISLLEKRLSFFKDNNLCPTCEQPIDENHRHSAESTINEDIVALTNELTAAKQHLAKLEAELVEFQKYQDKVSSLKNDLSQLKAKHSWTENARLQYESDLSVHQAKVAELESEQIELRSLAKTSMDLVSLKKQTFEQYGIQVDTVNLLRDTGIRSYIIKEYLPLINQLINKYLSVMDAYIQFQLDDTFNETILSRYRDSFTYASFSEGEKMRLDLAILFTWRQIARSKNSVRTNLLILDEVGDSSLDSAGVDSFLTLMNGAAADGQNVFVISHRGDQLTDKFDRTITIVKDGNFSKLSID